MLLTIKVVDADVTPSLTMLTIKAANSRAIEVV
jgi:hypothetical protein